MTSSTTVSNLKLAWHGLLDLLYPPHCLICAASGTPPVCDRCHQSFAPITEPVCALCGRPREAGVCPLCKIAADTGGWGFDVARASGIYQGPLREAIHRLKFQQVELLGDPLGQFLATRVVVDGLLAGCLPADEKIDALVPLPLHPAKQRQRGFNQSALIAAPLAGMLGVPLITALARPRKGRAQVGLAADARRGNVSIDSFAICGIALVIGKNIVLVDDVFTTGTTLSAGAATLKAAGAKRVIALALAAGG